MNKLMIIFYCIIVASYQKIYDINLDLPYDQRWNEFILDYKDELVYFEKTISTKLNISPYLKSFVEILSPLYQNQDIVEQVKAFSKITGINIGSLLIMNYSYELIAGCTSIITQDINGHIIHGRNFDYDFPALYDSISSQANFYKNNSILFKGPILAGFVGTHAIMKPNKFTITLNERDKDISLFKTIYDIVFKTTRPVPNMILKAAEDLDDFQSVVKYFQETQIDSSAYLIISGTQQNEGVVITRAYDHQSTDQLNSTQWYLVQTNYDRNQTDPASDCRRVPAEQILDRIGQGFINETNIETEILNLSPNKRDNTVETITMSSQTGYYNQTDWYQ